jgi:rRNA-processing protein FCF1
MSNFAAPIIKRHRSTGVILDTNILLLYVVGSFDPRIIPSFKRTKTFAIEDFSTLANVIRNTRILTTPSILTEVSNFVGQLPDNQRFDCFDILENAINQSVEYYIESAFIAKMSEFRRFGLTDAGIQHLAQAKRLVLTDDFRLSQYLGSIQIEVLNFNHIRTLNWR